MKKQFTPEQKKEYYANLRAQWNAAKQLAHDDLSIKNMYKTLLEMRFDVSETNIALVLMQAELLKLRGIPYIDFQTYEGWKESGFQVKEGEKSKIFSITWVGVGKRKNEDGEPTGEFENRIPKKTHLFHKSQVEPIEGNDQW